MQQALEAAVEHQAHRPLEASVGEVVGYLKPKLALEGAGVLPYLALGEGVEATWDRFPQLGL
jgi:hypothetical protein